MSILNSNDYDRGFTDGYQAALEGREKNYVASGMSLKFALHGSSAIDTYVEGYDEGYRIGMREANL